MPDRPEEICPHCGESFRLGRKSCPHCGSDAETGWMDPGLQDAQVELPTTHLDDDDYAGLIDAEHLESSSPRTDRERRFPLIALVLILLLAAALIYVQNR